MDITSIEPHINEFLKGVYKAFIQTPRVPSKSKHKDSCKVCGSHPVNSVKRTKIICRVCGTSHRGYAVFSNDGDLYSDTVLLDLRTKV